MPSGCVTIRRPTPLPHELFNAAVEFVIACPHLKLKLRAIVEMLSHRPCNDCKIPMQILPGCYKPLTFAAFDFFVAVLDDIGSLLPFAGRIDNVISAVAGKESSNARA